MQNIASESTLLEQGLDMMLYGMGSVFVFLFTLVVAIRLMSSLIAKFFPEPLISADQGASAVASIDSLTTDPLTTKIIQAAIDQHRGR